MPRPVRSDEKNCPDLTSPSVVFMESGQKPNVISMESALSPSRETTSSTFSSLLPHDRVPKAKTAMRAAASHIFVLCIIH
jgi:hypothetical protein